MKIVQISDCHLFADNDKVGYNNINPFRSFEQILAECKAQRPDVLLVTGDISGDGSGQSYQHFSQLVQEAQIGCRIGIIPGNHDNQKQLAFYVPEKYLWLHHPILVLPNQWHIHLLDTQYRHTIGQLSKDNLNSLTKYINQHSSDFHLLAAHHHPIKCGGWMDKHEWTNSHDFNAVVANHQSIKGVIYGHIHSAIEQQIEQCLYMACPSTCWQFANQESFATTDLKPGYRVINLLENGQISTSIRRLKE
jgi:Icc protein